MGLFDIFNKNKATSNLPKEAFSVYKGYPEIPYISPDRDILSWMEQVSLFNNVVPKENMVRLEENLLPGHILMLWRVGFNNFTNITTIPTYFEYQYGIDGNKAIQTLKTKQYIAQLSSQNSLKFMTVPQLKKILVELDVSPERIKDDLILQICEHVATDELDDLIYIRGYELTEKGKAILNKYQSIVDQHQSK